jgi:hypothetical protein
MCAVFEPENYAWCGMALSKFICCDAITGLRLNMEKVHRVFPAGRCKG